MTGGKKFEGLEFDYLIVDEACQSTELETLIALQHNPDKVILVGDQKQLAPTVISKNHEKTRYSRSLFERLLDCQVEKTMLNEQYRMHPEICKFPSTQFYWRELRNHKSVWDREDDLREL
jgi:superfamily I DNA and/or RNA helicase